MRRKLAGLVLAGALAVGVGPLATVAGAHDDGTDPASCYIISEAVLSRAIADHRSGHLTISELRSVLVGTAAFLGECLTPPEPTTPFPVPTIPTIPTFPPFPTFPIPTIPTFPLPNA